MLCLPITLLMLATGCESEIIGNYDVVEEEKQISHGEDEENMTWEQSFPEVAMPPVDQEVPENLETATLALG